MKRWQTIIASIILTSLATIVMAQQSGSNEILIKNATVMTASHGTIENGSILIRNGKIAAVGKSQDVKASSEPK